MWNQGVDFEAIPEPTFWDNFCQMLVDRPASGAGLIYLTLILIYLSGFLLKKWRKRCVATSESASIM